MKKRVSLLLLIVMLCFCACNANEDINTETEQSEMVNTESQEDAVDTETVADGPKLSSKISYPGTEYTWNDITVIIPEEWEGKYTVEESQCDLTFYQKASLEKDETMGWLCSISIGKEYYNDVPGLSLIAYTKEGTFYYLVMPTDVTFYEEDETIANEYMNMMKQCEWMAGSMSSTDEKICYDGSQYMLLTSSMYPLEQYHLMNLTNNNLWIARNEIYARHGMVFENAYLDSYFRSCSWYQPVDGKRSIPDNELSQVEKDNIAKIIEAEKAYAEAHPYPQQFAANTDVVEKLQGDERAHEICYETSMNEEYGFTSILKINGKAYNLDEYAYLSCPIQDVFYITDIAQDSKDFGDSNDGLEIAILDEGASDDPVTHFFKYNGELVYVGMVPGFPFKDYGNGIVNKDELVGLDGFTHQNGVYGTITTDLIETAYVDAYYWYDKENWAFKEMKIGLYTYKWNEAHELYVELPVYFSMSENSPMITMVPQDEVYFIKTDNKEWIFIRSKDGVEGYIHIKDGKILNINLPAEEVFSNLKFFG